MDEGSFVCPLRAFPSTMIPEAVQRSSNNVFYFEISLHISFSSTIADPDIRGLTCFLICDQSIQWPANKAQGPLGGSARAGEPIISRIRDLHNHPSSEQPVS